MSEEKLTILDKALTLHTKYIWLIFAVYGLVKFSAFIILFFWTGLFADAASYIGEEPHPLLILILVPTPYLILAGLGLILYFSWRKKPYYWYPLLTPKAEELFSHISRKEKANAARESLPASCLAVCLFILFFVFAEKKMLLPLLAAGILAGLSWLIGQDQYYKGLCSTPYAVEAGITRKMLTRRRITWKTLTRRW
jgi:hypothetical protein